MNDPILLSGTERELVALEKVFRSVIQELHLKVVKIADCNPVTGDVETDDKEANWRLTVYFGNCVQEALRFLELACPERSGYSVRKAQLALDPIAGALAHRK